MEEGKTANSIRVTKEFDWLEGLRMEDVWEGHRRIISGPGRLQVI